MTSLILRVSTKLLLPALVLLSWWALLRGHDAPGGGFIAGLIAAAGFALRTLASGPDLARSELRAPPLSFIGAGLLVALVAGLFGLLQGKPFLAAHWFFELPVIGTLGTPILFDVGIYLLVIGAVLTPMILLSEVEK